HALVGPQLVAAHQRAIQLGVDELVVARGREAHRAFAVIDARDAARRIRLRECGGKAPGEAEEHEDEMDRRAHEGFPPASRTPEPWERRITGSKARPGFRPFL